MGVRYRESDRLSLSGRFWPFLQAAIDQLIPEPVRELYTIPEEPTITTGTAHDRLSIRLDMAASRAPEFRYKPQVIRVLADAAHDP
jgi:hypothetical protein